MINTSERPHIKAMIADMANQIRAKIEGGTLYGQAIDMDDNDQLLVAAYMIGQQVYLRERLDVRSGKSSD